MSDQEILSTLRKYARYDPHCGKGGFECVVDKVFLSEVAERMEALMAVKKSCTSALHAMNDIYAWSSLRGDRGF